MRDSYGMNDGNQMGRQRDLVLSVNEFVFLQNKTDGSIKTQAGPMTITISQQEALVIFNAKSKKFEETNDFEKAKQLFIAPPEGWYTILKNPTSDGQYPTQGKANITPTTITVGKKINIPGPASFALFPGQMAKTVRGHKLRSNQYLLARVYDADAAQAGIKDATIVDANGNETEAKNEKYFVGQLMVIKGTEISFYIPPTGIEVIPQTPYGDDYVRDAVTLERLEYAILKDEDGEKRYVHGPAVVFPEPTETFMKAKKDSPIFRAYELSPISGLYVKVIADYEENGEKHKVGEELFITGNDQMIYYPRPEHAIIQYDGKFMHHAIAIPEGEGRYIMDRIKGTIKTVKGPAMYLPDPRTEVVVQRKLTRKECELMYPGNTEVLELNAGITEREMEKRARKGITNAQMDMLYSTKNLEATLAEFEVNSNISRGVSYTKPRTITLDTKYDGVVAIDVWTGYAINVVSKTGKREVVIGPATRLLDYDETIEGMYLSTGKPKTTDYLMSTGFLRIENNKISDVISAQTSDFVNVKIKVSYNVNFLDKYKDKWFAVDNYVKFLCDRERSLLKREIKKHDIQDFYANCTDIVRTIALNLDKELAEGEPTGRFFAENGMIVSDVEVLSVSMDSDIARMMEAHQNEMIEQAIQLRDNESQLKVARALADAEREKIEMQDKLAQYKTQLKEEQEKRDMAFRAEVAAKKRAEEAAKVKAEKDMQELLDAIAQAKLERDIATDNARIETERALAGIKEDEQFAYAETVKSIMESIQPDLVAAMQAQANASIANGIGSAVAPYAIANGDSVADVVNTMLRGTTVEGVLKNIKDIKE